MGWIELHTDWNYFTCKFGSLSFVAELAQTLELLNSSRYHPCYNWTDASTSYDSIEMIGLAGAETLNATVRIGYSNLNERLDEQLDEQVLAML